MSDRLQKLLDVVSDSDKTELHLVHNARIDAMRAYQAKPGKEAKADLEATRELYEETVDRLQRRYFPEDAPAPEGERFKNRKQALNWLQAQGYKVSQGKFYQDCEAGFPAIHKDGTVSRYQAMQYGQQLDVERRGSAPEDFGGDRGRDEARKIKAEADIKEMQADRERRELDRDWIQRDEAWAQLAALTGSLRDSLRHMANIAAPGIITLAGGDPSRAPEVYEGIEEMVFARAFNEVLSTGRIDAVFEDTTENEE